MNDIVILISLFLLSLVYGKVIYKGSTIRGSSGALSFFLSLYIAGKIYIDSGAYRLLPPFLVYYIVGIGYTSWLSILSNNELNALQEEKPLTWNIKSLIAFSLLISWSILALVISYRSTNKILPSINIFAGTLIVPAYVDKKALKRVFLAHLILAMLTSFSLALG